MEDASKYVFSPVRQQVTAPVTLATRSTLIIKPAQSSIIALRQMEDATIFAHIKDLVKVTVHVITDISLESMEKSVLPSIIVLF